MASRKKKSPSKKATGSKKKSRTTAGPTARKKPASKKPRTKKPSAKSTSGENKTKPTGASVSRFIAGVESESRRKDAQALVKFFQKATGDKAKMWGPSLIGFGTYHYKYASGREGDMLRTGFSPRKQNLVVYILPQLDNYTELLKKLGKVKLGKSCIYINKLSDIDLSVLDKLVKASLRDLDRKYGD